MEFVIVVLALIALDVLAMRFGADSRNPLEETRLNPEVIHAQI